MNEEPSESLTIPSEAADYALKTAGSDEKAEKEVNAMRDGKDLAKQADENQHDRREAVRDTISYWLDKWMMVAALLLIAATIVMAWHLLLPQNLRWLMPSEVIDIKDSITSVTIGAVFGFLARSKFL